MRLHLDEASGTGKRGWRQRQVRAVGGGEGAAGDTGLLEAHENARNQVEVVPAHPHERNKCQEIVHFKIINLHIL